MENSSSRKYVAFLFAVELVVFIALCTTYFRFTPDDGFIYLYGARQLSQGCIPNYTPGEPPTNAFGSQLWLILLAPSYLLSLPPLLWAKTLGLLLLVAAASLIGKILINLVAGLDKKHAYAASFAILCVPFMVASAVNVLDTLLATFLLILSVHAAVLIIRGRKVYFQAGAAAGLLINARPDAFLSALIIIAVLTYNLAQEGQERGRKTFLFVLGLLPGLLLFAVTALVYKEILPNSAAAKTPAMAEFFSLALYKRAFFIFVKDFSKDPVLYLLYISLVPFLRIVRDKRLNVLFVSLALVHLAVFLLVKDWMGIHRLYLPSIAVAFTAFLFVVITLFEEREKLLVLIAVAVLLLPMGYSHWKYHLGYNYAFPGAPSEQMGRFIAKHKLPDSYLMTCDMGVVPYFADIPAIDSNDAPICNRWRRRHLDDIEYLFKHNLDFIIMVNARPDGKGMPVFSINERLFSSRYFHENYAYAGVATWRPAIEDYKERGFSIGYGRYFHLYVSKRIWNLLGERKFTIF
jgi:hypothetical protein